MLQQLTQATFLCAPEKTIRKKVSSVNFKIIIGLDDLHVPRGGGGGGGQLAYVAIRGCAIILGTFFGVAPGFLGAFLGYSLILGIIFLTIPGLLGIMFW